MKSCRPEPREAANSAYKNHSFPIWIRLPSTKYGGSYDASALFTHQFVTGWDFLYITKFFPTTIIFVNISK
jgi:hypothetical protein